MGFFKSNNTKEETDLPMPPKVDLNITMKKNSEMIREIKADLDQLKGSSQSHSLNRQDGNSEIQSRLDKIQQQINDVDQKVEQNIQGTKERVEKFLNQRAFAHYGEEFNKARTENQSDFLIDKVKKSLARVEESMNNTFDQINQIQEKNEFKIKSLAEALEMLGKGVEELHQNINSRSIIAETQVETDIQFQELVHGITAEIRKDQKAIYESYTKLVNGYTENFHEEFANTVNKMQKSHDQVLDNILEQYTSNNIENELRKTIDNFSKEIRLEVEKVRLKITNDGHFKHELMQFRQEMQTLVDRKINEKFTAISQLITNIGTKTGEGVPLLNNANTQEPSSTTSLKETER
jgi:hypothetical protein